MRIRGRTWSGLAGKASIVILACIGASIAPAAAGAATITPNTTADDNNFNLANCSLREAVTAANTDADYGGCVRVGAVGVDMIPLPAGTYPLSSGQDDANTAGDLDFSLGDTTITHTGAAPAVIDGGDFDRVIDIFGGGLDVSISGVTVRNGLVLGNQGGVIRNQSNLVLSNATVSDGYTDGFGGGIINLGGGTTATLTNVTLSGNKAQMSGGGFYNLGGSATFTNVTVTGNTADLDNNNVGEGGGVAANTTATMLKDTVVAGNTDGTTIGNVFPDCADSPTSLGNNLIGTTAGCGYTSAGGDLTNMAAQLGPLADNGGSTSTHALLAGSPAIDHGAGCAATDQRGVLRSLGGVCDIGGYERVTCEGQLATAIGTDGADTLAGTGGVDVFALGAGNDRATGAGGNDLACGGSGADTLLGQAGLDRLLGEAGNDRLVGGAGRDTLLGAAGRDRLLGGAARDRLLGGAGPDTLIGGAARDRCIGGAGRDTQRTC
jgi:CSLREA domain-containing protein